MSFVTMLHAGSALRIVVLGAAAVVLAACGDDADTPAPATQEPAPVATPAPAADAPAPVAAPAPATTPAAPTATPAPAEPAAVGDAALLLGDWAPDAATCTQGVVMTVGNNAIGGAALGVAQCIINSRSREGDALTVVATCSSPDAAFRSVTMTLRATIIGDMQPATMTVLQQGDGLAAAATQPIDLVRCAAAPTP